MADTAETIEKTAAATAKLAEATKQVAAEQEAHAKIISQLESAFKSAYPELNQIVDKIGNMSTALLNSTSLTNEGAKSLQNFSNELNSLGFSIEAQSKLLAEFELMFTGVTESFTKFDSALERNSGINTYQSQLTELTTLFKNNKIASSVFEGSLKTLANSMGIGSKAVGLGVDALKHLIEVNVKAADEVQKVGTAMLKTAAASGQLSDLYSSVGEKLAGLNSKALDYSDIISSASVATNRSVDELSKFYMKLDGVPKLLDGTITGLDAASDGMSNFTAILHLMSSSQMDVNDVLKHAQTALHNYNLTGQDAIKFIAGISEINKKFGLEMVDAEKYMTNLSHSFKFMGDQTQSSMNILGNYINLFKDLKISKHEAIGMIENYTKKIGDLDIAQRAFLSAQSGGSGGLVGGFQITKMIQDGKLDQVAEMAENQLKRMFGNRIVSLDEASTNAGAASQYQKQIQMVRQGPLGSMFSTEAESMKFLEALSKRGSVGGTGVSAEDALKEALGKGKEVEDRSYTQMVEIAAATKKTSFHAEFIAENMVRTSFSSPEITNSPTRNIAESSAASATARRYSNTSSADIFAKDTGLRERYMYQDHADTMGAIGGFGRTLIGAGSNLGLSKSVSESADARLALAREEDNRIAKKPTTGSSPTTTAPGAVVAKKQEPITLRIEGWCIGCKKKQFDKSKQVAAGNPAAVDTSE